MAWYCGHTEGRRWIVALAVWAGVLMAVTPVVGQEGEPGGVDVQTFRAAAGPGGLLAVESSRTADHLKPWGALYAEMFSNPLVLRFDDGSEQSVVDQRTAATLMMGIGAGERFEFSVAMPMVLMDQGSYIDEPIEGAGPGDLRLRTKAQILSNRRSPLGVGAMVDVTAPTAGASMFRGSPSPTVTPALVVDTKAQTPAGTLTAALNAGAQLRSTQTVHNLEVGPQFVYGTGVQLEPVEGRWTVGADLYGAVGLVQMRRETSPLELVGGTRFRAVDGLWLTAAGGFGIIGGVGSSQWRGILGVSYAPFRIEEPPEPTPQQPVQHHVARECPPEPAGFEGPYDDDGCPVTPETFTGCDGLDDDWQGAVDEWGCPLLDSDGDGFLVWEDACPFEPREFIDEEEPDGCPNRDVDGDGIPNVEDHCPHQPGLRAFDGCPPPRDKEQVERVEDEEIEIAERVHFETDKAVIKEESFPLLEEVAMVIREHSDILVVEIAGHTDQRGDPHYNMMLSEERAKAVREFLIERGNVSPARLVARGYGEEEPVVDEETDEAFAENRRVEFRILETGPEEEGDPLQRQE